MTQTVTTAYNTFGNLIQRCVLRLGQVTGVGVQVYSEDILGEMLQTTFDTMLDELWWEDYMKTLVVPFDYTTGYPTDNVHDIGLHRSSDVQYIYVNDSYEPLRRMPERMNPQRLMKSKARSMYLTGDPDNVIRILPYGFEGDSVYMRFKTRPAGAFQPDDIVTMDSQALILGTCFDYMSDEGSNPSAVDKLLALYTNRLQQLQRARGWHEMRDPRGYIRTQDSSGWTTLPV